jgi:hypothetical protein
VYLDEVCGISTGVRTGPVDGAMYGMKRPARTIIVADEFTWRRTFAVDRQLVQIVSRRMSAYGSKRAGSSVI